MISKQAIEPLSHDLTVRFIECMDLRPGDTLTPKLRELAAEFTTPAGEGRCVMIWKQPVRNACGEEKGMCYGIQVLAEKGAA